MNFIPYGRQQISPEDVESVVSALKSDFLTQGPKVPAFEKTLKDYVGAEYALAMNSATSALHVACLALGVGEGDWVWTSPITFVASSNCALYCGAKVDFVDIDPNTLNLCPKTLEKKLKVAKEQSRIPKVVIPVHMAGQSCEMREIHRICQEYGVRIIEDASHAIGASFEGEKVGNCRYSDITIFSFHPVKIITTAEGGVATTNDIDLYERMDLLRSHGVTRNQKFFDNPSHGGWYYQQVDLGFNYRMTEMQAALGITQFEKLNSFVERRNAIAVKYNELFGQLPLKIFTPRDRITSSYHLYIIQIDDHERKAEVFSKLRESKIGVNLHYIPVHTQPYYKKLPYSEIFSCPNAEAYYLGAISIPLHPGMTEEEVEYIYNTLKEVL